MKILNGQKQTAEVELSHAVVAYSNFWQEVEEVSSLNIVEEEVNKMALFVCVVEFDDEGQLIVWNQYVVWVL